MDKKITLIRSSTLASVDYAHASSIPAGMEVLFLAGACPLDKKRKVPHPSTYEQQAKLCVENLKEVLKEADASLTDIVYTRVLVASGNRSDLVASWRAIREEFDDHDVPSTLSGVTVLGYEHQLVEIEAVAAVDRGTE
ncbi:RidA family protein [Bacillus sp. Marseille-Q1617]|uniref:RidA family protein n=1 Tax=Bacillus sp. Marseille-Q1617 TaxID=2736887 RepID=UPI001589AD50|nr:RidA family protein [Bacillus sp. Marseille-Q1617]